MDESPRGDSSIPPKTFLSLPTQSRERIYEQAGLTFSHAILVGSRSPRDRAHRTLACSLLQTCREIYAEVIALTFNKVHLIFGCFNIHQGLRFIRQLPPSTCSQLRNVSIHLYWQKHDASRGNEAYYGGENQNENYPWSPLTQHLVDDWKCTAAHLFTYVKPQTLRLQFVCDMDHGCEGASAILKPFYDFPGILKHCEIRIHPKPERKLSPLALDACVMAMQGPLAPFRFLDLPIEIRRQILEYTDIITPSKQLCWNSARRFHIGAPGYPGACSNDPEESIRGTHDHYVCQFFGCSYGVDYRDMKVCRRMNGGYSPSCKCWTCPQSLFLVCRTIYREAIDVLYSSNEVAIMPSYQKEDDSSFYIDVEMIGREMIGRELDAPGFLKHLNVDLLWRIRSLDIGFPVFAKDFDPQPSDPIVRDWCDALQHLNRSANIEALTMTISMATSEESRLKQISNWKSVQDDRQSYLGPHITFLKPLIQLRHMRRLFIHLDYIYLWCNRLDFYCFFWQPCIAAAEMEVWLEKLVMGDDYDSAVLGKDKRLPSDWLQEIWFENRDPW